MNLLTLRRALKDHKLFLFSILSGSNVRKTLRRASLEQLSLIARIFHEIFNANFPISEKTLSLIKKKRKFGIIESSFSSAEACNRLMEDKSHLLQVLLSLYTVLPVVLKPIK